MPEEKKPENSGPAEEKGKREFIKQKIIKRQASKSRTVVGLLKIALSGAIFGVVAIATAVVARPLAVKYLAKEPASTAESVSIPRDEPTTTAAQETTVIMPTAEKETEPVEEVVKSAMEKYNYSMKDLISAMNNLRSVADTSDSSVVAVSSVKNETDWFANSVQTQGLYSGLAIAKTDAELLILTTDKAVNGADALNVTFGSGGVMSASTKRVDAESGLAVVAVAINDANRSAIGKIVPVGLGNSYLVKRGDPIIAVGSPLGMVHSVDYGFISYVAKHVAVTDGLADVIYTDAKGNSAAGTWIMNSDGQLIGWITDAFKTEGEENSTTIMGVSTFKSILERMTNGQASPLLGLKAAEVTEEMQSQGMPAGLYVTALTNESPAYKAGIQPGDIITAIGGDKMQKMSDYIKKMEALHAEDAVKITVMRNGREAYTPLEFQATIGAR